MLDFKAYLDRNGLEDMRFIGVFHTWSNGSFGCANISRKLDRVLVKFSWISLFPQAEYKFLPHGISDHSLMVIRFGDLIPKKNIPLGFFNFWTLDPSFLHLVSTEWQKEIHGTKMFVLVQKLRVMKIPLKQLNKASYSNISARVTAYRDELYLCQKNLNLSPADDSLRLTENELSTKFTELSLAEELFYK
ncbi:uncharacterized protein LOC132296089 [Cornus florida]|uniref:uncharacterized protein LOC132296089 n=1 Tax=Cornus florida TaxID=4283 RepID=UPI00289A9D3E|nr:uncharacterized protein LOC132296089 [Cornus florida]